MLDPKRYDEFVGLVRLHTNRILGYLDALLLNRDDAEDLFQETCMVLWQKFDEFKPGTNFLAWALRVADRKVMNFQTRQSRRVAFTAGLRDALIAEIASRKTEDVADSLTALARCMERLAHGDRRMVTLCYAEGVPVPELADDLGRSSESVYHSLRRIRNGLLDCIHRELKHAGTPASAEHTIPTEEDGR
jgi:RNA polymerase sigma-70 factor, ECF subfamily